MTPTTNRDDARPPVPVHHDVQATRVWAAEAAVNWAVHRVMESGYRRATGAPLPTARDVDVPFRRILLWAVVTAAAIVSADVAVARIVLRSRPTPAASAPAACAGEPPQPALRTPPTPGGSMPT